MATEVVHDEVRADARMVVSMLGDDRVIFTLTAQDRMVRLVVRHGDRGQRFPMVTGVACLESLAHDLLAGYEWFGFDWLWLAMSDALPGRYRDGDTNGN